MTLYGCEVCSSLIRITEVASGRDLPKNAESIRLYRGEMQKSRLRRMTDRGTDVGLDLPRGTTLHHGDVLYGEDATITIQQISETVGVIRPAAGSVPTESWMLAAHVIGNMHRPVRVHHDRIIFPMQDSERETFMQMLHNIGSDVFRIEVTSMIFTPHVAADISDHG